MKEILNSITSYANFPHKGIIFKDILGLLQEPDVFQTVIKNMASSKKFHDADAIIAIEARGFIFGSAIAFQSGKPMIVARKPNKLPGELIEKEYKLEYGNNKLAIQKKSIEKHQKFIVIDDLLATGGTAKCVSDLISSAGKEVLEINVVVELESLNGRNNLRNHVQSQIKI